MVQTAILCNLLASPCAQSSHMDSSTIETLALCFVLEILFLQKKKMFFMYEKNPGWVLGDKC